MQLNPSGTYRDNGKIPFHFETSEGLNKHLLADAAIATGAFPVGLAPRVIVRDPKYINDHPLLKITHGMKYLADPLTDYAAVCVDGGVINNEPYDLTDKVLINRIIERSESEIRANQEQNYQPETFASAFDTTVLMIDPFPCFTEITPFQNNDLQALKFTAFQLFAAMEQQLLVKDDLLERALDENDFSRFMVAPIRTKKGKKAMNSLACGSVNGFGGFFSRKFRVHDYMLGRRNCQRFLKEYFCVPVDAGNPIIIQGYEQLKEVELKLFLSSDGKSLPIIPDIRVSPEKTFLVSPEVEGEFAYPSIEPKYLIQLEKKVKNRLSVVLQNLNNGSDPLNKVTPVNPFVSQIRQKSWFRRYLISPFGNFASDRFFSILKNTGIELVARKFIDSALADMEEKGLLR